MSAIWPIPTTSIGGSNVSLFKLSLLSFLCTGSRWTGDSPTCIPGRPRRKSGKVPDGFRRLPAVIWRNRTDEGRYNACGSEWLAASVSEPVRKGVDRRGLWMHDEKVIGWAVGWWKKSEYFIFCPSSPLIKMKLNQEEKDSHFGKILRAPH